LVSSTSTGVARMVIPLGEPIFFWS
jgi:hypothetical protein